MPWENESMESQFPMLNIPTWSFVSLQDVPLSIQQSKRAHLQILVLAQDNLNFSYTIPLGESYLHLVNQTLQRILLLCCQNPYLLYNSYYMIKSAFEK